MCVGCRRRFRYARPNRVRSEDQRIRKHFASDDERIRKDVASDDKR